MRLLLTAALGLSLAAPATSQTLYDRAYRLADELPLSPESAASALTGSFSQEADPLAFHLNPALLAGLGRQGGVYAAGAGSPNVGFGRADLANVAVAFGGEARLAGQPLAFGIGLSRTSYDAGTQEWTDDQGLALGALPGDDTAWSAAGGAGWSGPVEVDLGLGLHRRRGGAVVEDGALVRPRGTTLDAGLALTLPVFGRSPEGALAPVLDLSTGYAQRHVNLGSRLPAAWEASEDSGPPTRREGVMGYGVRLGLDAAVGGARLPLVVLDGRVEAVAALDRFEGICRGEEAPCEPLVLVRDALFGDMLNANNLLLGDGGQSVTGRRALRVTALGALSYTRGHFEGNGWTEGAATWGVSLDVARAARAVALATDAPGWARAAERLTLRTSYGVTNVSDGFIRTTYGGLTVGWKR